MVSTLLFFGWSQLNPSVHIVDQCKCGGNYGRQMHAIKRRKLLKTSKNMAEDHNGEVKVGSVGGTSKQSHEGCSISK